jgi:hypothetical protein
MTDWQRTGTATRGCLGIWNGWRDIAPQSSAIACTGPDNAGNLMLIHKASSTVLLGAGYTATVEMILKFMERERILSDPG